MVAIVQSKVSAVSFGRITPYYIQAACALPCNLLYFIQFASLHTQESVHRNVCANGGDEDAEEQYGTARYGQYLPSDDAQHILLVAIKPVHTTCQHHNGQQGGHNTHADGLLNEGTADESPRRTN